MTQKKYPAIIDVRGAGLMWGIELNMDAAPVHEAATRQGVLVNRTAGTVIRLLPPLIITKEELDRAIGLLDAGVQRSVRGSDDMNQPQLSRAQARHYVDGVNGRSADFRLRVKLRRTAVASAEAVRSAASPGTGRLSFGRLSAAMHGRFTS